ncbi:UNVERIFIED_CONTAM: hypothetical protein RMT77_007215 [Armadillidium vulgare]
MSENNVIQYIQKKGHEETNIGLTIYSKKCAVSFESSFSNPNSENYFQSVSCRRKFLFWLKEIFLPQGYPHSVSPDYLHYQIWDSLQAYCSNLAGALSLHSTLVGIGVGQENASPLAAAISWLTKDGAGMISSITFAYYKGSELDYNSKQWRLFADIINDGAHFVRLLAPFLPFPFLLVLCCSSVMNSLVGVAGGATRASLIQHQALCNNMADVSAKDGSQETLVNLAGLITSLTLLPVLTSSPIITWATFLLLVCLHVFTNFKAMRSLHMKTLNRPRLLQIFHSYVRDLFVPEVEITNENEPLFLGPAFIQNYLTDHFKLEGGVSINYINENFYNEEDAFNQLILNQASDFEETNYMVFLNSKSSKFYILYHESAKNEDIIESFWASFLCAVNLNQRKDTLLENFKIGNYVNSSDLLIKSKKKAKESMGALVLMLQEKGWLTDPLRLNIGDWKLGGKKYV